MSRLFNDASSQYLENSDPVVTAYPFTMACWFNVNDATINQSLMSIGDDGTEAYFCLFAEGATAGDPAGAWVRAGASSAGATTSAGWSVNTWNHVTGVFSSSTSRTCYLNGGSSGTSTTNLTPDVAGGQTAIGRLTRLTPTAYTSGMVAEAAIWDVALSAADAAVLATGASPLMVRPESLVAYWPLTGNYSPEIDVVGGFNMTVTGATKDVHNAILYPRRTPMSWKIPSVAASNSFFLPILGVG